MLTLTDQLVVTRPGHEIETAHVTEEIRGRVSDVRGASPAEVAGVLEASEGARIYFTDAALVEAASTDIRRAASEGRGAELAALVAPPVADYINKYGLYREESGAEFFDAGTNRKH